MTQTGHAGVVDSYELSPTQEGMLFHSLLREATGVDLEQIVCTVRGPFDEHAFVAAFHEVATRHAILRTRFSHDGVGRPVQEVVETVAIPVERLDLAQVESSERPRRFDQSVALDRARGIDLGRAADTQLRGARRGARPGLRTKRGAAAPERRCPRAWDLERVRIRRAQRRALPGGLVTQAPPTNDIALTERRHAR